LPPLEAPDADDGTDAFVEQLITPGVDRVPKLPRKRRPRLDLERYAGLMLGVIFHEYTGKRPVRTWDDYRGTDRASAFYMFATEAFRAAGLVPSPQVFREVGERWDRSRNFHKRSMHTLLFGGLTPLGKTKRPRRE
jgi:hypothetical protein